MATHKRPTQNNRSSHTSNSRNHSNDNENKYQSKSFAELQLVEPQAGDKFDAFKKIFAWKTTKRFGFLSLQAYKNKEQKTLHGDSVKDGYEKWYVDLKSGSGKQRLSALYNVKKKILFFEMGTTKCAVSPTKGYFSFLMPEAIKNAKLRR